MNFLADLKFTRKLLKGQFFRTIFPWQNLQKNNEFQKVFIPLKNSQGMSLISLGLIIV